MSLSAISSAVAGYVKQVTSGATAQNATSSAMEEAQETQAMTAKEAAHGDRQAKLKLAREQQQQQQQGQQSTPVKEPGKGEMIDHNA